MNRTHVILDLWTKEQTLAWGNWYLTAKEPGYTYAEQRHTQQFVTDVFMAEKAKGIVSYFVPGQPYANADDMREDYKRGFLAISTDNNNQPFLGTWSNLEFRFAHDCHHSQTDDCNFVLWGEVCAWSKFAAYTQSAKIRNWLWAEIVGQLCALVATGTFPEQKYLIAPNEFRAIAEKAYGLTPATLP